MKENSSYYHNLLASVYRREAKAMMAVALLFLPANEAQDTVHDVFLKLLSKEYLLALPDDQLHYVLLRSVKNHCANALRHKDVMRRHNYLAMNDILQDYIHHDEYIKTCDLNLRKIADLEALLPEKRREVFRLHYHDGLSIQQIAEKLLISRRTVENNLYRALVWIREHINKP